MGDNQTPYLNLNLGTDAVENRNWAVLDRRIYDLARGLFANIPAGGDLTGFYPDPVIKDGAMTPAKIAAGGDPGEILSINGAGQLVWVAAPAATPTGPAGGDLAGSTYPNPQVIGCSGGVFSVTPRGRLTAATGQVNLFANPPGDPNYLVAKSGWLSSYDYDTLDTWTVQRRTPGTGTYVSLVTLKGSTGKLFCQLDDSIVHRVMCHADTWLSPVPMAADVAKVLTVTAGPTLAWSVPAAGGIADAPSDGTLYGRQNAIWTAVTGGGGGAPTGPAGGDLTGTYPNPSVLLAAPLPIAQGGTAATTAPVALTNLGALAKAGDTATGMMTFTGGLNFGSVGASPGTSLAKHLALFGSTYGFNIVGGAIQVVAGGAVINTFTPTGFTGVIGATLPAAGSFSTVSASGATTIGGQLNANGNILIRPTSGAPSVAFDNGGVSLTPAGGAPIGIFNNYVGGPLAGQMYWYATQQWAAGVNGTGFSLRMIQPSTATLRERLRFDGTGCAINGPDGTLLLTLDATGQLILPTTAQGNALQWGTQTAKGHLGHYPSPNPWSTWSENAALNAGATAWVQDDATKPSWIIHNGTSDTFSVARMPAGGAYGSLLTLDATGQLTLPGPTAAGVDQASLKFGSRTIKGRVVQLSSYDWIGLINNDAWTGSSWTQDNPAQNSWHLALTQDDRLIVERRAPNNAVATLPFSVQGSDGKTYCTLADASVTHAMLAGGATAGNRQFISNITFSTSTYNSWVLIATLPALVTRGSPVYLTANHGCSFACITASGNVGIFLGWFRNGAQIGLSSSGKCGGAIVVPIAGCSGYDMPPAGTWTYDLRVYIESGLSATVSAYSIWSFLAAQEIG